MGRPGLAVLLAAAGAIVAAPPAAPAAEAKRPIETLVFVRHGEKPKDGLGLLTCRGLNRALRLPAFFASNFPRPDFIFAPDPSVKATEIHGDGQRYDYVRPLLTIGPTAIRLGVPINTQLPYNDPGLLADTLLDARYHDATVYVAWEHLNIVHFAEILVTRFQSPAKVPEWDNGDYDTVFVFTIDWGTPRSMKFEVRSENLGTLAENCPQ